MVLCGMQPNAGFATCLSAQLLEPEDLFAIFYRDTLEEGEGALLALTYMRTTLPEHFLHHFAAVYHFDGTADVAHVFDVGV